MNKSSENWNEVPERIAYLIAGFIQQTLKPQEHYELDRWVEESDENMLLFEKLTDEENIEAGLAEMQSVDTEKAYNHLKQKIDFKKGKKTVSFLPYAIAASLILVLGASYFLGVFEPGETEQVTTTITNNTDIAPGSDKATLRLADGRTIVLDEQAIGNITLESGAHILKHDSGQIAYNPGSGAQGELLYNTLITPKGGQYQVRLSDGTRVWMNAGSSLKYPVVFGGDERIVELSGEAYLEVATDAKRPFHVKTAYQQIRVLGTSFNVNAYPDDVHIITTLVEGRIQLSAGNKTKIVSAGQQYVTDAGGEIQLNKNADPVSAVAWKEGVFKFRNEKIETILKQIARWYDAEIVYEGKVNHHFNGEISRNLPVSKVLKLLQQTGRVHFDVEGRKIKVRP